MVKEHPRQHHADEKAGDKEEEPIFRSTSPPTCRARLVAEVKRELRLLHDEQTANRGSCHASPSTPTSPIAEVPSPQRRREVVEQERQGLLRDLRLRRPAALDRAELYDAAQIYFSTPPVYYQCCYRRVVNMLAALHIFPIPSESAVLSILGETGYNPESNDTAPMNFGQWQHLVDTTKLSFLRRQREDDEDYEALKSAVMLPSSRQKDAATVDTMVPLTPASANGEGCMEESQVPRAVVDICGVVSSPLVHGAAQWLSLAATEREAPPTEVDDPDAAIPALQSAHDVNPLDAFSGLVVTPAAARQLLLMDAAERKGLLEYFVLSLGAVDPDYRGELSPIQQLQCASLSVACGHDVNDHFLGEDWWQALQLPVSTLEYCDVLVVPEECQPVAPSPPVLPPSIKDGGRVVSFGDAMTFHDEDLADAPLVSPHYISFLRDQIVRCPIDDRNVCATLPQANTNRVAHQLTTNAVGGNGGLNTSYASVLFQEPSQLEAAADAASASPPRPHSSAATTACNDRREAPQEFRESQSEDNRETSLAEKGISFCSSGGGGNQQFSGSAFDDGRDASAPPPHVPHTPRTASNRPAAHPPDAFYSFCPGSSSPPLSSPGSASPLSLYAGAGHKPEGSSVVVPTAGLSCQLSDANFSGGGDNTDGVQTLPKRRLLSPQIDFEEFLQLVTLHRILVEHHLKAGTRIPYLPSHQSLTAPSFEKVVRVASGVDLVRSSLMQTKHQVGCVSPTGEAVNRHGSGKRADELRSPRASGGHSGASAVTPSRHPYSALDAPDWGGGGARSSCGASQRNPQTGGHHSTRRTLGSTTSNFLSSSQSSMSDAEKIIERIDAMGPKRHTSPEHGSVPTWMAHMEKWLCDQAHEEDLRLIVKRLRGHEQRMERHVVPYGDVRSRYGRGNVHRHAPAAIIAQPSSVLRVTDRKPATATVAPRPFVVGAIQKDLSTHAMKLSTPAPPPPRRLGQQSTGAFINVAMSASVMGAALDRRQPASGADAHPCGNAPLLPSPPPSDHGRYGDTGHSRASSYPAYIRVHRLAPTALTAALDSVHTTTPRRNDDRSAKDPQRAAGALGTPRRADRSTPRHESLDHTPEFHRERMATYRSVFQLT